MGYLLSLDLSDWNPQNIPTTKMKVETMREHLPNPIRFIIDHISPWSENQINKPSYENLYQIYITRCSDNEEKPLTSRVARKKFSQIGIERKQVRINGRN